VRRGNKHFDSFADRLERELADSTQLEARARRLAELLALALQGSLLVRHAPPEVADAFCAIMLSVIDEIRTEITAGLFEF
jgi:putative acyl-CoA dehydrogenase